jgi:hypothetical protein
MDAHRTPTAMAMIIEAEPEKYAETFFNTESYTASGIVFSSLEFQKWQQVMPDLLKYELAKIIK